jgi:uncharacterized protein YkwD
MNGKLSIIISVILVTAAILTVQSSSMLQPSYAQSCPDGSTPDASGNCPTLPTPPADEEETAEAPPPAGDEETAQAPPLATTETPPPVQAPPATTETPPPPATEAPPPATTETPPPPATQTPPPATIAITSNLPTITETPHPPATEAPSAVVSPQGSNNTNSTKIPPYCRSCNDDIYNGTGDFASMILDGHNRERAKLGVAPLVWNNELATHAQEWVNWNLEHGTLTHCVFVPGNEQIEPCKYPAGENGAHRTPASCPLANDSAIFCTRAPPAQMQEFWFAENPTDHWLQVVSKTATSIGCGYASGPNPPLNGDPDLSARDVMYCRYSPPGLDVPGMICAGTCTEIKDP